MPVITSISRPESVTNLKINLIALLCALLVLIVGAIFRAYISQEITALCSISMLIFIIDELESRYFKRSMTSGQLFSWVIFRSANHGRVWIKLLALYFILAMIAFFYWVFPEYHKSMYQTFYMLATRGVPILCGIAIPYFYYVDSKAADAEDGYFHLGQFLLGRLHSLDHNKIFQCLLGWLVKAFFLPLMTGGWIHDFLFFFNLDFQKGPWTFSFASFYDLTYRLIFFIDVLFATVGYLCTLKLFDSQIRSTESTAFGWLVAIVCYPPFWDYVAQGYFAYQNTSWIFWLKDYPVLCILWGCCILALLSIYTLSTICFGLRFSNLTNRGIITNGPYRYTKHPAYITKCLAWWLIFMPYISSHGVLDAVRQSVMLALLSMIYFMRAKTEERHLSQDAVYIHYAHYIDQYGIFSGLGRRFSWLKFKPGRLLNLSN